MMKTRALLFSLVALPALAWSAPAVAQCSGNAPSNYFCGNISGSSALPGWRPLTPAVLQPVAGGTVLGNPTGASAVPVATPTPVLGIAGTTLGTLGLSGNTSGLVTIRAGAVAGTYNFVLPAAAGTAGYPLLSGGGGTTAQSYAILGLPAGGTNAALTASNGGLVYSTGSALAILSGTATAGQIPQSGASAAPSWSTATYPATAAQGTILNAGSANVLSATATPVLGIPGTTLGTLGFAGNTSGTVTVRPQATAGSPTLTLPNTTGTFAVNASTPLVLSATTGGLTCPTCVTSSGGGAITGQAPIVVSGAGLVSITGAAGQVLAGATPAFTATPVLGVAGSTVGTLGFANATSGTVTLQPVTGALGAVTINIPAASGTIAVSATSPITLSAAGAIGVTGSALTKTDDTNVTLTLGGTPTTALLQATSLTLGWTGQLGLTRGGTAASLTASNGGIVYSTASAMAILSGTATAGQHLQSGSSAAPSWTTTTYPSTAAAGTILNAGSANIITATATPTLGANGGTGGQITFNGSTSGSAALRVAAAAGSTTFQLPVGNGTSGQVLSTDGAGATSWVPVGGTGTVTSIDANAGAKTASGSAITTTGTVQLDGNYTGFATSNCTFIASVASNLLTVAMKDNAGADPSSTSPCLINYPSVTATSGDTNLVAQTSALSINTNATGATLGSSNATAFRFWVVVIDNGGTNVMALYNASNGTSCSSLNDGDIISSTPMSGTATAVGTFYTPNGTTVTSKAYRIVGYLEYNSTGLTTAGTYATAPTIVRPFGPGVKKPCEPVQIAVYSLGGGSSTTSTSPVDVTGATVSITPRSAANRIKYRFSFSGYATPLAATNVTASVYCTRAGSNIIAVFFAADSASGGNSSRGGGSCLGLDSLNSTSATIYKLQHSISNASSSSVTGAVGIEVEEIMGTAPQLYDNDNDPRLLNRAV